jgi:hypothetical protein
VTEIGGSGSESGSGSISPRHGPPDPDPHQNVLELQRWFKGSVPHFCSKHPILGVQTVRPVERAAPAGPGQRAEGGCGAAGPGVAGRGNIPGLRLRHLHPPLGHPLPHLCPNLGGTLRRVRSVGESKVIICSLLLDVSIVNCVFPLFPIFCLCCVYSWRTTVYAVSLCCLPYGMD